MSSEVLARIGAELAGLMAFVNNSTYATRWGDPSICDFVFGNPHDMPLTGLVDALKRHAEPKNKDWFAYTFSETHATEPIARELTERTGLAYELEDIIMTPGSFGALAVTFRALAGPGDEVIYFSPPWFFYAPMITFNGATPVRLTLKPPTFAPDLGELEAAITDRTVAVLVNTPHNPSGRLYTREELQQVATVLERSGRPITLMSDESYRRIVFDDRTFVSPAEVYEHTIVLYTYGKQLLAPGERIGYAALSPTIAERESLRETMYLSQIVGGWQFPNAILQRALPEIAELSIDLAALQRRRDRLCGALKDMGYEVIVPEATFYAMVRCPTDEARFVELLAEHEVFVGPGSIFEMPGWFRISLTANDDMVERSLPGFEAALKAATA